MEIAGGNTGPIMKLWRRKTEMWKTEKTGKRSSIVFVILKENPWLWQTLILQSKLMSIINSFNYLET